MESGKDTVYVLAVDDLPDKLLAMELVLQQPGLKLVQARSGREALRRLLEQDFAVILLDVNMPDIDGFETARLIRQRKRSEDTPIIFVTAFSDEMHAARGYSLGAVDYILSPVIPEVLRTKVGVFVDLYRKKEDAKRQAEQRVALAREQAARAVAEEATRRSLFLAEASTKLANSLDFGATAAVLLKLVVPALADLAGFTAASETGRPWRTDMTWVDPNDGTLRESAPDATEGADNAVRTAVREVLSSGKMEVLRGISVPYPADGKPTGHTVTDAVALPLLARGRTLGVLMLAQGSSGRRFDAADLLLAEDLAGRAAVALDNARLYRELQDADRQKNEFLAMLAHELRNPLAPIRNAVQVLQADNSSQRQQQWSREVIARQVQQMVRMVDDLLDVSRITRGKITLRPEVLDVASVVADAVETSRPLIDSRHHQLSVTLPPGPLRVRGDAARLAQVVSNLLNNAAKYTEDGGRIWLTAERSGDEIVVRVRDTGQGVPPEMLTRIFEPFTQVDRSIDRSQGGLGIGLTLARRLIEMHGGRVSCDSQGAGCGSEFVIHLPALAPDSEPSQSINGWHALDESAPIHSRTLIIDDNVDGADSLSVLLQALGVEVRTAYDGPTGLQLAAEFRPDVVLLDIGLPRMDGYEVARRLREGLDGKNLMLIAVSGYGQDEDRRRSKQAGFDHHLVKPVSQELLLSLLRGRPRNLAASPGS
jgi:signal transduction histidine kinase/DNA-binding response OmpR family regulator